MAAVSGDPLEDAGRVHGSECSVRTGHQSVQQISREENDNKTLGIGIARFHDMRDQARSISMPIIEKTVSIGGKSLLQQRAQAVGGNLRLPSFKSLGIALPHPDHLLTPPDEPDMGLYDPSSLPQYAAQIPRSAPVATNITMASMNQTTPPQDSDAPSQNKGIKEATTPTIESAQSTDVTAQNVPPSIELALERQQSSSSEEDTPRGPMWLDGAVDAIVTKVPRSGTAGNTITALCQSQPSPTPDELGPGITASRTVVEALQFQLTPGQYIDITHAVPPRFNMGLLPSSPIGTPNPTTGEIDYFSISVFPKAAVALDYDTALRSPVPSSCRTVAPPDTVGVALLERYIPPTSAQEYLNLFSTDGPSALVDRLDELCPDGGSLLFIYPTFTGATTFASRYLGPLLDPLLRTLVGIHGLTTDLSQDIGKMVAVDSMFTFEKLVRKITFMLPRLRNPSSPSSPATQRKFTLAHSSKQVVQVDRETWTQWWLQQEAPRIKEVVRRYYKRGSRLPQRKDITEGGLAREVLDGVKARDYGLYDGPRSGIEVGVFVIKRIA